MKLKYRVIRLDEKVIDPVFRDTYAVFVSRGGRVESATRMMAPIFANALTADVFAVVCQRLQVLGDGLSLADDVREFVRADNERKERRAQGLLGPRHMLLAVDFLIQMAEPA